MKKLLLRALSCSLMACLSVFYFVPVGVLADGMVIERDPYADRWDYSSENNQRAFISYDNGTEKMIISTGIDSQDDKDALWLFPVPADPNKVVIDVIDQIPNIRGEEISKEAQKNLDDIYDSLAQTQIYTIPLMFSTGRSTSYRGDSYGAPGTAGWGYSTSNGIKQDVTVYEHLDKEGVTTEIVTAKTANGLYDYFQGKGLKIDKGSIPVLDSYVGKEYSFVASWMSQKTQETVTPQVSQTQQAPQTEQKPQTQITDQLIKDKLILYMGDEYHYPKFDPVIISMRKQYPEFGKSEDSVKFLKSEEGAAIFQDLMQRIKNDPSLIEYTPYDPNKQNTNDYNLTQTKNIKIPKPIGQKGILVTFPTQDLYFPLLPTSVYGSKTVPATIRVTGYVSPKIFRDIQGYSKIEYYTNGSLSSYGSNSNLKNFYPNSGDIEYTKIDINAPSKLLTDDLWIKRQVPLVIYPLSFMAGHPTATMVIMLILISLITGIIVGSIFFPNLRKNPVKLGLVGLSNCLTIIGLIIASMFISAKEKDENTKRLLDEVKKRGYWTKRRISRFLSNLAKPFLLLGFIAFFPLINIAFENDFGNFNLENFFEILTIPVLILYVLPILAIIIANRLSEIKEEDKELFKEIEAAGYSQWSFTPKNESKVAFIMAFSATFLFISAISIKLIESWIK